MVDENTPVDTPQDLNTPTFSVKGNQITLDLTDPNARAALKGFAASARVNGDEDLAADVEYLVSNAEVEAGEAVQDSPVILNEA